MATIYSRKLRVEEKENKRKATGFLLLTLATVLAMYFFGLPLLIKVSNFAYDIRKSGEPIESSDSTPPPPPYIESLPAYTNKDKVEVKGRTEPGATAIFIFNGKNYEALANAEGSFSHEFSLSEGENSLIVYSQDSSGNKGNSTQEFSITQDKKPPDLEVTRPHNGDEFYGSKSKQIAVEGKTEKDAQVQINDRFVVVNSEGSFSLVVGLNSGENSLNVKSQDLAGNIKETSLKVTYIP